MLAFFPIAGYAATQTSDDTGGTSIEPSVTFSRSIEAGKAVASRALSSKAKAANAEATAAASLDEKKKYVFEYPEPAVIDETMEPVQKKIDGEIGLVIKAGMNVEFDRKASTSNDLWIEFTKGIKAEGVGALSEFLPGDKVRVTYEEAKDGSRRAVRSIKLLKRKTEEEKKREAEAEARAEAALAKKSAMSEES
ncbi:MAG: hypothetical protein ABH891_03525 [Candidatus Omnitrophota bacterium]